MVVSEFTIRPATDEDVPRLAELDRIKFGGTGMDVYDESYFTCWRRVNPEGLLVAEHDGSVVGYRYSQYVDFALEDIPYLTTNDAFTDSGHTQRTHKPTGNCINGVSVCSSVRGAGRVLFEVIFKQLLQQGRRYYFGFSRIPGFNEYIQGIRGAGINTDHVSEQDMATWYAFACAQRVNGLVHDHVPPPVVRLPAPDKPDPVLSKYLHHKGFGVAAILPNWIKDPASRDFGVMVLFKNPNL